VNDNVLAHGITTDYDHNRTSKLFDSAFSVAGLTKAWMAIKSHSGMMTRGVTPETLNLIDEKWFVTTSSLLFQGNFKYPHRRRIHIPKPDGLCPLLKKRGKMGTRPLTIAQARVKIIEKALLDAIEPCWEGAWQWKEIDAQEYSSSKKDKSIPSNDLKRNKNGHFLKQWILPTAFSPNSHGFRPNKSPHTAIRAVKSWKSNAAWLIEYDVKKAFDNVNRSRLRRIFLNHINEPRLWKEIEKMINAGIVDPNLTYEDKGVPQGSVLSPFLFNIYMNELDKFVEDLSNKIALKGLRDLDAKRAYQKIVDEFSSRRVANALKRYGSVEGVRLAVRQKKKQFYEEYGASQGESKDRFLSYVRYADDFLIALGGSRELATESQKRINNFLKSDLHLEVKESRIISRPEGKGAKFLGFRVYLSNRNRKTRVKWNRFESIAKYKRRVLERFKASDRRTARAFVEGARRDLIRAYQNKLEGERLNRSSMRAASSELIESYQIDNSENPAMQR
jgi:retron-type reverse transcriptase